MTTTSNADPRLVELRNVQWLGDGTYGFVVRLTLAHPAYPGVTWTPAVKFSRIVSASDRRADVAAVAAIVVGANDDAGSDSDGDPMDVVSDSGVDSSETDSLPTLVEALHEATTARLLASLRLPTLLAYYGEMRATARLLLPLARPLASGTPRLRHAIGACAAAHGIDIGAGPAVVATRLENDEDAATSVSSSMSVLSSPPTPAANAAAAAATDWVVSVSEYADRGRFYDWCLRQDQRLAARDSAALREILFTLLWTLATAQRQYGIALNDVSFGNIWLTQRPLREFATAHQLIDDSGTAHDFDVPHGLRDASTGVDAYLTPVLGDYGFSVYYASRLSSQDASVLPPGIYNLFPNREFANMGTLPSPDIVFFPGQRRGAWSDTFALGVVALGIAACAERPYGMIEPRHIDATLALLNDGGDGSRVFTANANERMALSWLLLLDALGQSNTETGLPRDHPDLPYTTSPVLRALTASPRWQSTWERFRLFAPVYDMVASIRRRHGSEVLRFLRCLLVWHPSQCHDSGVPAAAPVANALAKLFFHPLFKSYRRGPPLAAPGLLKRGLDSPTDARRTRVLQAAKIGLNTRDVPITSPSGARHAACIFKRAEEPAVENLARVLGPDAFEIRLRQLAVTALTVFAQAAAPPPPPVGSEPGAEPRAKMARLRADDEDLDGLPLMT